jgi:hypothetical protein
MQKHKLQAPRIQLSAKDLDRLADLYAKKPDNGQSIGQKEVVKSA